MAPTLHLHQQKFCFVIHPRFFRIGTLKGNFHSSISPILPSTFQYAAGVHIHLVSAIFFIISLTLETVPEDQIKARF